MILDPAWIVVLSGVVAVLAALALLRSSRSNPALLGTISEISARVDLLRSMLADNSQRERQDAENSCARIPGGDRRAD